MIRDEIKKSFKEGLKGPVKSHARRIKTLAEISEGHEHAGGIARPTNVAVRMSDGEPMRYFTDGSLRHATGFKPGKAARKARKRANRSRQADR